MSKRGCSRLTAVAIALGAILLLSVLTDGARQGQFVRTNAGACAVGLEPLQVKQQVWEGSWLNQAKTLLADMTLRDKVLQLFIVTPQAVTDLGADPVGGIIYFADDLQNPEQTRTMIADAQAASPLGLFISVDEEGGAVSRLGSNPAMGMPPLPNMGAIETPEEAREVGATLAKELLALGFNLDFAPVADVNSNPQNPVIGDRAFCGDAGIAARLVAACVDGFQEGGILCTLKHFPGHGDTDADTHLGMAVTVKTPEELRQCELQPFAAGIDAGADLVMVSHISVPALTGDGTPACLSKAITTDLLREELGFAGIAITDSMTMGAITGRYGADEAAVLALRAGIDIILMPEDLPLAVDGILNSVRTGELTEERIDESVLRILMCKLEQGIIVSEEGF